MRDFRFLVFCDVLKKYFFMSGAAEAGAFEISSIKL